MINWNYDESQYKESSFALIPEGDHRCRIEEVTEKTFRSGKSGLEMTLAISGYSSKVWFYLVLDPMNPERTNQSIGSVFSSFGIADHNIQHYQSWVGKVGACRIKHEEYNGEKSAKVRFFLGANDSKRKNLPPWKEPEGSKAPAQATATSDGFTPIDVNADDVPF